MVGHGWRWHAAAMSESSALDSVAGPAPPSYDGGIANSGWLGVELRHLVALAAVARAGSFRGAAEQLGYVQSAVSQQIATLERAVGTLLVDRSRGNRRVALTPSGELLLGHATGILAKLGAARADLAALASSTPDEVRVGLSSGVGRGLLAGILTLLAARQPRTQVVLTESASRDALAALVEEGKLDLAIAEQPVPARVVERCELLRDPYALLLPSQDTRPVGWRPTSLEEIAELPLIGPTTSPPYADCCAAEGVELRFVVRTDLDDLVPALVRAGVGAAVVPRLSLPAHPSELRVLELDGLLPPRVLSLIWHRERILNGTLEAFRSAALDACRLPGPALAAAAC